MKLPRGSNSKRRRASQQYSVYLNSTFTGPARFENIDTDGQQTARFFIGALATIADGQELILESGVTSVNTAGASTDLITGIPRQFIPVGYRFKVTTGLTGTDDRSL